MGVHRKYTVALTAEERSELERMVSVGRHAARSITRARILLLVEAGRSDKDITGVLGICGATISNTTGRFADERLGALNERPRCGGAVKLTGDVRARMTAIASTTPPEGYARWTLNMIADRTVALGVLESVSDESVRTVLKKTFLSRT